MCDHEESVDIIEAIAKCAVLTCASLVAALIPKKLVIKLYGIFMGLASGALMAVVFSHLLPEIFEKFQDQVKHDDELVHFWGRTISMLMVGGMLAGYGIEGVVHFFMPEGHCHGVSHCKHGHEHQCSTDMKNLEKNGCKTGHNHQPKHDDMIHVHESASHDDHGSHHHDDHGSHHHKNHSHDRNHHKEHDSGSIDLEKLDVESTNDDENPNGNRCTIWFQKLLQFKTVIYLYAICMFVHGITDGMILGMPKADWWVVLALFGHELPHCLGTYGFYVNYGASKTHSVFLLVLSSLGFYVGAIMMYFLGQAKLDNFELISNCLVTGMFFYIVFLILIPETLDFKSKRDACARFAAFAITFIGLTVLIFTTHPDHGNHHHDHHGSYHHDHDSHE